MGDRVAIFIDGSNLYHALETNFRRHDLNFTEFISKLCGSRILYRVYYYNVLQEPAKRQDTQKVQQDFLDILHRTPYLEVRLGSTKVSQGVAVEKGIDIMIATDLLTLAWNNLYDVAILVSGDSDFVYALQAVKNMGKYVEVAYFENVVSRYLLEIADSRQLLDRIFFTGVWASKPHIKKKRISPWSRRRPEPILNAPPITVASEQTIPQPIELLNP